MINPPANPTPPHLAPTPSPSARPNPGGPAPLPGPAGPKPGRTSPVSAAAGCELARPYAALALARLAEMIDDPDPKVALPACRDILDRAWGKAEAATRAAYEETLVVVVQIGETPDA